MAELLTADKRSPDAWLIEWNAGRHEKLLANEREAERESLILAEDGWEDVEVIPLFRAAAVETNGEDARRTAEYWKAEHLAGNKEIERLRAGLQLMAMDEHRLMNVAARQTAESILAGKPAHPETAAEPSPCEHLRSELLAEKTKDGEPLFQMRKCLDCGKGFRVRSSLKAGG
jgi:hypothetical protein